MANALKNAPLKNEEVLVETKVKLNDSQVLLKDFSFDANRQYEFELVLSNPQREYPVQESLDGKRWFNSPQKAFKPYQNILLTSQIVWKGQRRNIRYYDGCDSIFVNEQPQDKDLIAQLITQTNRDKYRFLDGKFFCFGDEAMLLLYLMICSWNAESPYRTRTADAIFVSVDKIKYADEETKKLDLAEKALQSAKEATVVKMNIHAAYLGIPMLDNDTGNERTEKEVRAEYRKFALRNPDKFMESYGDPKLEIRYYLQKSLETGLIHNKENPNWHQWKTGTRICETGGLRSQEAIVDKLYEFSQTELGEEFLIQLKAVVDK